MINCVSKDSISRVSIWLALGSGKLVLPSLNHLAAVAEFFGYCRVAKEYSHATRSSMSIETGYNFKIPACAINKPGPTISGPN